MFRQFVSRLREQATNTIAQGDTREVGLDPIEGKKGSIYRAVASRKLPGKAKLEISQLWIFKGNWAGDSILGGLIVPKISTAGPTSISTTAPTKPNKAFASPSATPPVAKS